jgi:hypothetical protein
MSDLPKELFVKNKDRKNTVPEPPRPEYERLNRYPAGYDPKQGKPMSAIMFKDEQKKVMQDFQMNKKTSKTSGSIPAQTPNIGTISGYTEDQSWNNPELVMVEEDPNKEEFKVEDIPEPGEIPPPPTVSGLSFVHQIPPHSIVLIVGEEAFFCSSMEEAEEQVEHLVFQEKISLKEISVIYKPELGMGTFLKSRI